VNLGSMTVTLGLDANGAITTMRNYERATITSVQRIKSAYATLNLTGKGITPVVNTKPAVESINKIGTSLASVNSSLQRFGYLASTALTLPLVLVGKGAL